MNKMIFFMKKHPVPSACAAAALLLAAVIAVHALFSRPAKDAEQPAAESGTEIPAVMVFENGRERTALLTDLTGQALDPGKEYPEKLTAVNGSDEPEYIRMIIRRYWKDAAGNKTETDPEYIRFSFGEEDYNTAAWKENTAEKTQEQAVYYLTQALEDGAESAPLFDAVCIDPAVLDGASFVTENGVTRPEYADSGLTFVIEAEVQYVQAEQPDEAMKSAWGVQNVSIEGGIVTVTEAQ